jgi:hypothetical protein
LPLSVIYRILLRRIMIPIILPGALHALRGGGRTERRRENEEAFAAAQLSPRWLDRWGALAPRLILYYTKVH